MLKVTYLESGLYLEYLPEQMESWISLRVVLALRIGRRIVMERTSASLLLPIDLVNRSNLDAIATPDMMTLAQVDAEYIEVNLQGVWISSDHQETEGVFVTSLESAIELALFTLWTAQMNPSSVGR